VLIQALSLGGGISNDIILQLRCSVSLSLDVRIPRAAPEYGGFNQLHAFARWRHDRRHSDGSAVFLGPAKGKPSGVHSSKLNKPERDEFIDLFDPTGSLNMECIATWGSFVEDLRKHTTKIPTLFRDEWLAHNLSKHKWLGTAWRAKADSSLSPTCSPMTIKEILELYDEPQIFVSPEGKAAPFKFPKTAREKEIICSAVTLVCDKVLNNFSGNIKDLHAPDPLGLKFSPTITLD
jgi:hypothetical protein